MTIKPLTPPYPAEVEKLLAGYPQQNGYLLSLFRLFANSPRFLGGKGVVNHLDKGSPLTLRDREIVILQTCAHFDCEYEWGVHVTIFGEAAKLTEAQVRSTREKDINADWPTRDQLLINVVKDLCKNSSLSASYRELFEENWQVDQQFEILALVGNYFLVSLMANTYQLDTEDFAASFPDT